MDERDKNGIEEAMKRYAARCPHKTHGQKLCAGCATAAAIYYVERYLDADLAALRELVRELVKELHRTGTDDSTLLARADKTLAGAEPQEGKEPPA